MKNRYLNIHSKYKFLTIKLLQHANGIYPWMMPTILSIENHSLHISVTSSTASLNPKSKFHTVTLIVSTLQLIGSNRIIKPIWIFQLDCRLTFIRKTPEYDGESMLSKSKPCLLDFMHIIQHAIVINEAGTTKLIFCDLVTEYSPAISA